MADHPPDVRLIQLARIYDREAAAFDMAAARDGIRVDPGPLADAVYAELLASDDVTSEEAAREYIAARLDALGDIVGPPDRDAVRVAVERRIATWNLPAASP